MSCQIGEWIRYFYHNVKPEKTTCIKPGMLCLTSCKVHNTGLGDVAIATQCPRTISGGRGKGFSKFGSNSSAQSTTQ